MENPNQENNPLNPMARFSADVKKSIEILKDKHNESAKAIELLQTKFNDLKLQVDELKNFLTFNSYKYRKFINKVEHQSKY